MVFYQDCFFPCNLNFSGTTSQPAHNKFDTSMFVSQHMDRKRLNLCCLFRPCCSDVLQRSQTLLIIWFCWAALYWSWSITSHCTCRHPTTDQQKWCVCLIIGSESGCSYRETLLTSGVKAAIAPIFSLSLYVKVYKLVALIRLLSWYNKAKTKLCDNVRDILTLVRYTLLFLHRYM